MDELKELLADWFQKELYLATVVESGRTTHGSHYYREVEQNAEWAREALAEKLLEHQLNEVMS